MEFTVENMRPGGAEEIAAATGCAAPCQVAAAWRSQAMVGSAAVIGTAVVVAAATVALPAKRCSTRTKRVPIACAGACVLLGCVTFVVAAATSWPGGRYVKLRYTILGAHETGSAASTPLPEPAIVEIPWTPPTAASMSGGSCAAPGGAFVWNRMSAVCWTFGRRMFDHLGGEVPIGLVDASVGGTEIAAWSDAATAEQCPAHRCSPATDGVDATIASCSGLWNGMVAPLTRMRLAGILWYQGENDVSACGMAHHDPEPDPDQP